MVTIIDVANQAQVSAATVSRVLNNSYLVTEETKNRVMQAIQETGYQIPARMKINAVMEDKSNSKATILVISSIYMEELMSAMQLAAENYGFSIVYFFYDSADLFSSLETLLTRLQPSLLGIILINAIDNSEAFQKLLQPYPLVQVGDGIMQNTNNYIVYNDEIKMSQDATDYLFDQGCKQIAILSAEPGNMLLFTHKRRFQGYCLSLIEHHESYDPMLCVYADITIDGGYKAINELLRNNPTVDGIFCICDTLCIGALLALKNAEQPTPKKIHFITIDKNEIWSLKNIRIPYIDMHMDEIGENAVKLLHSLLTEVFSSDVKVLVPHSLENITD